MTSKKRPILKYAGYTLLAIFLVFNLWLLFSGKLFFYKALLYNYADIDDYKIFPQRQIRKSPKPQPWPSSAGYGKHVISDSLRKELDSLKTVALLIIKNDSVLYEEYWQGYGPASYSNSFSMAKSFVSALVGAALQDGSIKSIDQPVCDFLPEFCEGRKKIITLRHLLMMSSGLDWDEGYASPFSITTEAYYGTDLKKTISRLQSIETPGKNFRYKSGDTQILSFILEKATGKKLSIYMQEKLWAPMGCVGDAIWSLDQPEGYEKAYCCINSNARDFAKLGKLYMDGGVWNNTRLIPEEYIKQSLTPNGLPDGDLDYKASDFYGFQWWLIPDYKGHRIFYARGILGQYIISIPDERIIIVRLGEIRGVKKGKHFHEIFSMVEEALKMSGSR